MEKEKDSAIMLLIAARMGATNAVVKTVEELGGGVRFRNDTAGYVRALIPEDAVACLLSTAPIESVSFDVGRFSGNNTSFADSPPWLTGKAQHRADPSLPMGARRRSEKREDPWPMQVWRQGSWRQDPFNRPYHPLSDMGARDWRRVYPDYDGRGVVIAHQEGFLDLLLPELAVATSPDGKRVRKVIDFLTTDNPVETEGVGSEHLYANVWVPMRDRVNAVSGRFEHQGRSYTAPRSGSFLFGILKTDRKICRALDPRDPVMDSNILSKSRRTDDDCNFAVLWDVETGEVWLDANRDSGFADERAMRDYPERYDVGVVGHDDPVTRARETYSFVVQTSPSTGHVAILLGLGGHSAMVAGSLAGSRGVEGHMDGMAPGAQIVELQSGSLTRSEGQTLEGLIAAFIDSRTDIVHTMETGQLELSAGRVDFGDGRKASSIILDRLIALTHKPLVAPAGNNPKDASVHIIGQQRWGLTAGAYTSAAAWWINEGIRVPHALSLHSVGSYGPGDNGAIQPTVLAPSSWLTSERGRNDVGGYGSYLEGLYQLPPGYTIGSGTSQAGPTLAGAVALLVSAAKQEKLPYDARRLWLAVTNSARFAPHIPAYKQGNGFLDVTAALDLLRAYARHSPTIVIESRGPVRTAWSHKFKTPHEGVSLYEREGWSVGMEKTRTIRLTRSSGPAEPLTFTLSWLGNEARTFQAPASVTLPLNEPVALPIRVAPKAAGFHSALLNLDHPSTPGHVYRLMTAIIAAERFDAQNAYTVTIEDVVDRPNPIATYYFQVPPGAAVLDVEAHNGDYDEIWLWKPQAKEFLTSTGGRLGTNEGWAWNKFASFQSPESGVWAVGSRLLRSNKPPRTGLNYLDLRWSNPGADPDPPVPVHVKTKLLGTKITLVKPGPALRSGRNLTVEAEVRNAFAPFVGGVVNTSLGSGRVERGRLAPGEQRAYDIDIPVGAQMLEVALPDMSKEAALDLSLLDCTVDPCNHVATVDEPTAERVLRQHQPRAGRWRVVVGAPYALAEGVDYEYRDLVLDPALGGVVSTDAPRERAVNERWRAMLNVWRSAANPAPGRRPYLVVIAEATLSDGSKAPVGVSATSLGEKAATISPPR